MHLQIFKMKPFPNNWAAFFIVLGLSMGVSACESRLDTRGNLLDPDKVIEVKPGKHTREDVADILGSPSSVTTFGSDAWYYIAKRTETFAFFAPKVTERQILVVYFSKDGKVKNVDTVALEEGRAIEQVKRKTPTHGNKITALEQLIGNLGRFKKKNENKPASKQPY